MTRPGRRCKLKTCKYWPMCWIHTRKTLGILVKPSTIPGAGFGVFAQKPFRKNQIIAEYGPNIARLRLTKDQCRASPSHYLAALSGGRCVDSQSLKSYPTRYINDCPASSKRRGHCRGTNAKFTIVARRAGRPERINVKATKNIRKGQEIFVSYGAGYWRRHGQPQ